MDKDPTSDEPTPETIDSAEALSSDTAETVSESDVKDAAEEAKPVETEVSEERAASEPVPEKEPTSEKPDQPVEETAAGSKPGPVDLSALQGFDFGTSWSESKPTGGHSGRSERRPGGSRPPRGDRHERKDRRAFKPGGFRKAPRRESGDSHSRPFKGGQGRRPQPGRPDVPKKVVEVSFYPEDNGFKALCKALRISTITYELFDIARTILEKDERFYMIIRPVDAKGAPDEEASIFVSEADGLPFLKEEGASMHALSGCLDHFFTSESREVDPPSGSFSSVRKCGFTGELLGPPNFHRIQKIMADHHASRLSHMPYAKFESRVEAVSDEEVIAEWLEKMKTQVTYTLKPEFGESRQFEDGETARAYVKANLGDKLVREVKSARVEGSQIAQVKDGLLRSNLEFSWERQKRFPLDTANLLRGRLRRQKFALYKKGAKGVSYVCAVKRRFREPNESFSQPIQDLLAFLDANPHLGVKDLSEKYLGFSTHATEGEEAKELTAEQQAKHKALTLDFQWLLKEGYIAEYSNGTIFAHPPAGPGQDIASKKAAVASPVETKAQSSTAEDKPKAADVASSKRESKSDTPATETASIDAAKVSKTESSELDQSDVSEGPVISEDSEPKRQAVDPDDSPESSVTTEDKQAESESASDTPDVKLEEAMSSTEEPSEVEVASSVEEETAPASEEISKTESSELDQPVVSEDPVTSEDSEQKPDATDSDDSSEDSVTSEDKQPESDSASDTPDVNSEEAVGSTEEASNAEEEVTSGDVEENAPGEADAPADEKPKS